MSIKKVHDKQPSNFEFSTENLKIAESILKKYPKERKKIAVMPFYIWLNVRMIIGFL